MLGDVTTLATYNLLAVLKAVLLYAYAPITSKQGRHSLFCFHGVRRLCTPVSGYP